MSPGAKLAAWIAGVAAVGAAGIGIAYAAGSKNTPSATPTPPTPSKGGGGQTPPPGVETWQPTTRIESNRSYRASAIENTPLSPAQIAALNAIDVAIEGGMAGMRVYRAGEALPADWPKEDAGDLDPNRRRTEFKTKAMVAPLILPPIPGLKVWVLSS